MYGKCIPGVSLIGCGAGPKLLPNTHGNSLLTIVSVAAIVVGTAIVASTLVRFALKRAYQA